MSFVDLCRSVGVDVGVGVGRFDPPCGADATKCSGATRMGRLSQPTYPAAWVVFSCHFVDTVSVSLLVRVGRPPFAAPSAPLTCFPCARLRARSIRFVFSSYSCSWGRRNSATATGGGDVFLYDILTNVVTPRFIHLLGRTRCPSSMTTSTSRTARRRWAGVWDSSPRAGAWVCDFFCVICKASSSNLSSIIVGMSVSGLRAYLVALLSCVPTCLGALAVAFYSRRFVLLMRLLDRKQNGNSRYFPSFFVLCPPRT